MMLDPSVREPLLAAIPKLRCADASEQERLERGKLQTSAQGHHQRDWRDDARGLRQPAVCASCLAIDGFGGIFGAGASGVRPRADGP